MGLGKLVRAILGENNKKEKPKKKRAAAHPEADRTTQTSAGPASTNHVNRAQPQGVDSETDSPAQASKDHTTVEETSTDHTSAEAGTSSRINVASTNETNSEAASTSHVDTGAASANHTSAVAESTNDGNTAPNASNVAGTATQDYGSNRRPLQTLPPEIRNRIVGLLVLEARPIRIMYRRTLPNEEMAFKILNPRARSAGLPLAQTCRQFNAEVSRVFYGANSFRLMANLCWNQDPSPRALPFRLADTRHFILTFRPCNWRLYAEIHIDMQQDNTLAITVSGTMERCCICRVRSLARLYTGPGAIEFLMNRLRLDGVLTLIEANVFCSGDVVDRCKVCGGGVRR